MVGRMRGAARAAHGWLRRHPGAAAGIAVGPLAVLALRVGLPLGVRLRDGSLAVPEDHVVALALVFGLVVAAALAASALRARARAGRGVDPDARSAGFVTTAAASLAVAVWFNFGWLHGGVFVHHWDQFHYQLGSKYFPELGYDGLYVASVGAQADAFPGAMVHEYVRDLRTYEVVHVATLTPHMREVWRRFTPERWREFMADNASFVSAAGPDALGAWRLDHGFNGTPAWTFVARLFDAWLPSTPGVRVALGLLDVALLVGACTVVFATFGARTGCACLVLLGFGYASRFFWLGGSFLRLDWLAAVMVGVCMLERRRFATAGALLGYAAMARLFPALLLAGPAVAAVRDLARGERPAWARRLALGVAAAVLAGFVAGSATGRGPRAWTEFAGAISLHADTWLTNNVGLPILFAYDRAILERRDVDWLAPEPWIGVQPRVRGHLEARRPLLLLAQAGFLAMLALAAWRAPLPEATLAGLAAVFALLSPTAYYWAALVALPLARRPGLFRGALALNLAMFAVHLAHPAFEMRYAALSLGLAALFLAWLAPDAVRTLRAGRAARARPVPVSAAS